MGGKNQTVTTQTSMPAFVTTAYQNLFKRAEPASKKPFAYYTGNRLAGFTPDQNAAFARVRGLGDVFSPYASRAQGLLGQAGSSLDTAGSTAGMMSGDITRAGAAADTAGAGIAGLLPDYTRSLMSPYQDEVVDATMENLLRGNLTEQNALLGRAISSGANPFGGDRAGLAAAELARSQGLARGQVIGELRNTGWQNAMQAGLGALQGDQAARAQQAQLLSGLAGHRAAQAGLYGDIAAQRAGLASQEAGLGSTAFNTQQAAAKAGLETGALQQQQAQAGADLAYKNWLERQNYDKSQIEWLSQVLAGRGDYGNTTTETKPGPSPLNSILGLLTAGIGAFVKDGGRIEGMADGGRMPWDNPAEEEADRNRMLHLDLEAPSFDMIQAPGGSYVPSWENVPSVLPFEVGRGGGHLAAPDDVAQWRQAVVAGASPAEAATAQRAPAVDRPGQPVPTDVKELARLIGLDRVRPSQEAPGLGAEVAPIEAPAPGLGGFGSRLRRIGDEPWRYGLVMGGLAAAGSESPYPLTALGQGLAAGLGAAMQVREARDTRAAEERARQAQLDAQTEIVTTADGRIWIVHPSTGEKIDTGLTAPSKAPESTEKERILARMGLKPGTPEYLNEWLKMSRAASGTPDAAQETAGAKVMGENFAKTYQTTMDEAAAARNQVATLSAMNALLDAGAYTGTGSRQVLTLNRAVAALGGDPGAAADIEAFDALAKNSALSAMGGSLGSGFSNADRDFVTGQVMGIENTREGNRLLSEIQLRIAQHKIEIANFTNEYARSHGGQLDTDYYSALDQWAEEHPQFDEDFKAKVYAITGANPDGPEAGASEPLPQALKDVGWTQEQFDALTPDERKQAIKLATTGAPDG